MTCDTECEQKWNKNNCRHILPFVGQLDWFVGKYLVKKKDSFVFKMQVHSWILLTL